MTDKDRREERLYVDESLVDLAQDMYSISSKLADAEAIFDKAMLTLRDNYKNEQATALMSQIQSELGTQIASLKDLYSKYSNYIWYVLGEMTKVDTSLAAKVRDRMKNYT